MNRISRFLSLLLMPALGGCSLKLSGADGSTTYLGVVNIRENPTGHTPFVHSKRYGLMVDAGARNNGIALGYDDRLIIVPEDNAITEIDYQPGVADPSYFVEKHPRH